MVQDFVLDTTAFTEIRVRQKIGAKSLSEVITRLVELFRETRMLLEVHYYMTPSMWNELRRFLLGNGVSLDLVNELGTWVTVKAPDKLNVRIPASVFSEYVSDMRKRIYKGLRVAEDAIAKVHRECGTKECLGNVIRDLRDKYRNALRKGIIDSPEDLDAVILALELRAAIVSSDAGIKHMSEQLGIMVIDPEHFVDSLERMLRMARKYGTRKTGRP
ncbi:MAG: RNA ligase partner protein [Desulfurococcales archaeon]|nr:RNA ligase partner protein [Desulfurococcales archaeon]